MVVKFFFVHAALGHNDEGNAKILPLRMIKLSPIFIILLPLYVSCAQNPTTIEIQNSVIEIISDQGTEGSALIVYQPGFSDFQEKITSSFAQGLVDAQWQVDRCTTSKATLVNLAKYDLLIIGTNTYWWNIDRPTRHFLSESNIPENVMVTGLITAAGASGRAERKLHKSIEDAGGTVIDIKSFWAMRPNDVEDTRPNRVVAIDKAYLMGQTMTSATK